MLGKDWEQDLPRNVWDTVRRTQAIMFTGEKPANPWCTHWKGSWHQCDNSAGCVGTQTDEISATSFIQDMDAGDTVEQVFRADWPERDFRGHVDVEEESAGFCCQVCEQFSTPLEPTTWGDLMGVQVNRRLVSDIDGTYSVDKTEMRIPIMLKAKTEDGGTEVFHLSLMVNRRGTVASGHYHVIEKKDGLGSWRHWDTWEGNASGKMVQPEAFGSGDDVQFRSTLVVGLVYRKVSSTGPPGPKAASGNKSKRSQLLRNIARHARTKYALGKVGAEGGAKSPAGRGNKERWDKLKRARGKGAEAGDAREETGIHAVERRADEIEATDMQVDTEEARGFEAKEDGALSAEHGDEGSEAREGGSSSWRSGRDTSSAYKEVSSNKRQGGALPLTPGRAGTGGAKRAKANDEGTEVRGDEDTNGTGATGGRGVFDNDVHGRGGGPPPAVSPRSSLIQPPPPPAIPQPPPPLSPAPTLEGGINFGDRRGHRVNNRAGATGNDRCNHRTDQELIGRGRNRVAEEPGVAYTDQVEGAQTEEQGRTTESDRGGGDRGSDNHGINKRQRLKAVRAEAGDTTISAWMPRAGDTGARVVAAGRGRGRTTPAWMTQASDTGGRVTGIGTGGGRGSGGGESVLDGGGRTLRIDAETQRKEASVGEEGRGRDWPIPPLRSREGATGGKGGSGVDRGSRGREECAGRGPRGSGSGTCSGGARGRGGGTHGGAGGGAGGDAGRGSGSRGGDAVSRPRSTTKNRRISVGKKVAQRLRMDRAKQAKLAKRVAKDAP